MAALGFGGKFLESIKSLYKDDFVTSEVNGVTTVPVYLGRGLRQGCSLSPILFAIYVADMSNDLHASNLGVTLQKICVSCLFLPITVYWLPVTLMDCDNSVTSSSGTVRRWI